MNKIAECVSNYIHHVREPAKVEYAFFAKQASLTVVIEVAASGQRADGKRHSHQRRIPRAVLDEAVRRLHANMDAVEATNCFQELHDRVGAIIGPLPGIGELTIYDVAHRIGAFLNIEPEHVYLHAGARKGAAAIGYSGRVVKKEQLPPEFLPLTPAEIEDCLCIFKEDLWSRSPSFSPCAKQAKVSSCLPKTERIAKPC